ncbi:hypothetical protein [Actinacidiphila rubida]|uniref:Uncharacterized protein n=1 Tax=Actinacidiphila rubida TaxID=310780 RepID=A0A1H8GQP6_9ACTN|nr:hypothetical protein [Actinacidiphila rubida]SEN46054.1 hypothetical protein SAMN05216267_1005221 [Actinacidiphila rubida]
MTGGSAHRAGRLALWALLLGLFLMHGSPSAAAEGCHGAAYSPRPAAAMAMPAHAAPGPHAAVRPVSPAASAGPAHSGGTCTATPARGRTAPAAAGTAAGPPVPAPAAAPGPAPGPERRGPPGGGRELLLRVSVARR